ncbi:hypothetical protein HD806DRAFT_524134 [Xylariaceae sp. AK1471]|nr:hypothetical protein HD806DRAFT_524134 [Xylariaceae sp. AK1471]
MSHKEVLYKVASSIRVYKEFTIAATSLNFDVSPITVEAPEEYRGIANVFSPAHIHEAETGPLHVTVRRAYGMRAIEVSREFAEIDSRDNRSNNWVRAYKAALPVCLLASIIARMWTHTEATMLWAEIVEQGERFKPELAPATQQEITRDHLPRWDAGARAWLQSADSNVNIAINQANTPPYENVIRVWTIALSVMEDQVSGRPHVVQDDPILLGLSDISESTHIELKDPLVKAGGKISLGFSDAVLESIRANPMLHTRQLNFNGSRLTFDELVLLKSVENVSTREPVPWENVLVKPLNEFLAGNQQSALAVSLGHRRPKFLPAEITKGRKQFLRLTYLPTLLYLLESKDRNIRILRRLASRVEGLNDTNSIMVLFKLSTQRDDFAVVSAFHKPLIQTDVDSKRRPMHHRWIELPREAYRNSERLAESQGSKNAGLGSNGISRISDLIADDKSYLNTDRTERPLETVEYMDSDTESWFFDTLTQTIQFGLEPEDTYGFFMGQRDDCIPMDHYPICEHASIYCKGHGNLDATRRDFTVPEVFFEDILWCFESGLISPEREPAACGATIASTIVNNPFNDRLKTLNRFSAICHTEYFETAFNVAKGLNSDYRVIGLSGGDSIFIWARLLKDTAEECTETSFTRILGNTGHPGFSILTIPLECRNKHGDAIHVC